MKSLIRPVFTLFILLTLVTGVIYPLLVTGLSQSFFPFQANGSLVKHNGELAGSQLVGQEFTDVRYFWGRPSATSITPYNSFDQVSLTGSSGSNLGPLSQLLVDTVTDRVNVLRSVDSNNLLPVPVDLVTASASGLDPHISVAAAYYQVHRVALAREMTETELKALLDQFIEPRQLGVLGEPRVNVFLLNLALDGIQ